MLATLKALKIQKRRAKLISGVISQVTGVFTALSDWIVKTIPSVVTVFYDGESGLTFLGTLAVCGLAISIFFLLMGLIQNFLHFRG